MSKPDYRRLTLSHAKDAWLLRKEELTMLLDFASKDKFRSELEHAVFTDHSIMCCDGTRLLIVTQRGRTVHDITDFIAVHRDTLLRARRAMLSKKERLRVPLRAGDQIEILHWPEYVDEAKQPLVMTSFPGVATVGAEAKRGTPWYWVRRLRGLSERLEEKKGRYSHVNPAFFEQAMKAVRILGFKTVRLKMGSGSKGYTTVTIDGHNDSSLHTFDVRILIMGKAVR